MTSAKRTRIDSMRVAPDGILARPASATARDNGPLTRNRVLPIFGRRMAQGSYRSPSTFIRTASLAASVFS